MSQPEGPQPAPTPDVSPVDRPAILHVDDEEMIPRTMNRILRSEPVDFRAVISKVDNPGLSQVMTLAEELGDRLRLVFVDGVMHPGSHGIDVVDALDRAGRLTRRDEILSQGRVERSKLAAVLVSGGLADRVLQKRTFAALADGRLSAYLGKPFSPEDLRELVRGFAESTMTEDFLTKLRERAGEEWASMPPQTY